MCLKIQLKSQVNAIRDKYNTLRNIEERKIYKNREEKNHRIKQK